MSKDEMNPLQLHRAIEMLGLPDPYPPDKGGVFRPKMCSYDSRMIDRICEEMVDDGWAQYGDKYPGGISYLLTPLGILEVVRQTGVPIVLEPWMAVLNRSELRRNRIT